MSHPQFRSRYTGRHCRKRFGIWLLVLAALSLVACAESDDTWQRIRESGIIRIGLDPTYPPFEWIEDDDLKGIDADLGAALAEDLGLQADFVYFGYDGLYDALYTDQVDLILSAMVILPERMKDFAYSNPYYDAGQLLVSRVPINNFNPEDIEFDSVAVELGSEGHLMARQWQRIHPNLLIKTRRSIDDALLQVVDGTVDAAVVDSVSGRLFTANRPELDLSTTQVSSESFAAVVRKEDDELLEQINQSLSKLDASGKLERIYQRWFFQAEQP